VENKNLLSVEVRTGRRHVRQQSGRRRHPGCGESGTGAPTPMSTSLLMCARYSCANRMANRHLHQHQQSV